MPLHYCCSKLELSSLSPYLSRCLPLHHTHAHARTHTHPPSLLRQGILKTCTVMHYIFRMATYRERISMSTNRLTLLLVGHSFVRRMQQQVCPGDATQRYYCPDLLLSHMFEKVVFLGKGGGLTLDGLLRDFSAVRAEAPNVVLIDIGTNDLCNGCVAEELVEGIVTFARKLTTMPSVLQVVICHILTRIPKSSGRFVVPGNFETTRHGVSDTVVRLTSNFYN